MRNINNRLVLVVAALAASQVLAGPTVKYSTDQRGDFVIIGNTIAQECDPSAPPPTAPGSFVGNCSNFPGGTDPDGGTDVIADSAPDIFWRSEALPDGGAIADISIPPSQARSSAMLNLPAGAVVTYARLYWGAEYGQDNGAGLPSDAGVATVTLERPGTSNSVTVTSDNTRYTTNNYIVDHYFYQSAADVTQYVKAWGTGKYRVSGIQTTDIRDTDDLLAFAGWSLVVFYTLPSDPPRNLVLFDDGDDFIPQGGNVTANISGFLVPDAGYDAKLGVFTYEGDVVFSGDSLQFGGNNLSDAQNPATNFFNSTRSYNGSPVTVAGDQPQNTGGPGSMSGLDLDVVNITSQVSVGMTNANINFTTSSDRFVIGALVTSISTYKPVFTDTLKTFTDITHPPSGPLRPGDVIEYTVTTHNTGSDTGVDVVMTDPLPAGITYVPGSLQISSGYNQGPLTDAADSDQGEYVAATRKIVVRLGAGANGTQGGSITTTDPLQVVKFRVTINAGFSGSIANLATINSSGLVGKGQGIGPVGFPSSDGSGPGSPTTFIVDGCLTNTDCSSTPATPYCDTSAHPYHCVGCLDNTNCSNPLPYCAPPPQQVCSACTGDGTPSCTDPTHPACQLSGPLSGSCTQCSATNTSQCTGATPACNTGTGTCVQCVDNSTCSGSTPICDTSTHTCVACLSNGNCGGSTPVCSSGTCIQCIDNTNCGGSTPLCDTSAHQCVACLSNNDCSGTTPYCNPTGHVCQACGSNGPPSCTNTSLPACLASGACGQCNATETSQCTGVTPACDTGTNTCVQCVTDANCGGATPVCNTSNHTCGTCTNDASCAPTGNPACQASGPLAGQCTQCSASNTSACTGSTPACNAATGTCVQCVDDSTCSGATPVCNTSSHTCVACTDDTSCAPTGRPACQTSGTLAGQCTQCSASNSSACTGATPACDTAQGTCVECVSNAQCPAARPVCNASTHTCQTSTTTDGGTTDGGTDGGTTDGGTTDGGQDGYVAGGGCGCQGTQGGASGGLMMLAAWGLWLVALRRRALR